MPRSVHVLIMEDDLYARDFMSMLLMRDWRSRVIASVSNERELRTVLSQTPNQIDLILLDTEVPHEPDWISKIRQLVKLSRPDCIILCTGTKPDRTTLQQIISLKCQGYILKGEIRYGLAVAVQYAISGKWVITPNVEDAAQEYKIALPNETIVIESQIKMEALTPREKEVAKLSILFNLSQHDLQDELLISAGQIGKYVHNSYEKMGLHDFLTGDALPESFLESELVMSRFKKAHEQSQSGKHIPNMATLAFHLLTLIEVKSR